MGQNTRAERVADQIQRELSVLIQREVKDPRLTSLVTITAVQVTRDFSYAKIYVTILSDEEEQKNVLKILNNAAGYFRSSLAKLIKLRTTPQLRFVYDTSIEYGNRLSKLIEDLEDNEPSN